MVAADVPEHVEILTGEQGLTKVLLKHSNGAAAEVSKHLSITIPGHFRTQVKGARFGSHNAARQRWYSGFGRQQADLSQLCHKAGTACTRCICSAAA